MDDVKTSQKQKPRNFGANDSNKICNNPDCMHKSQNHTEFTRSCHKSGCRCKKFQDGGDDLP